MLHGIMKGKINWLKKGIFVASVWLEWKYNIYLSGVKIYYLGAVVA